MKKLILLLALAPLSAFAGTTYENARVESVTPQVEEIRIQGQCRTVNVSEQQSVQGNSGLGGSILGGLVGGLLGSQVGGGHGATAATAAGAIAGTLVGGNMARSEPGTQTVNRARQHCELDRWSTRTTGYLVAYEYRGQRDSVVMDYDPGNSLQMRVTAEPLVTRTR
jgi:uncharacterized protein YcfJ